MLKSYLKVAMLFIASLLFYTPAFACNSVSDERLRVYCLFNTINNKNISKDFALYVDRELKRVGYSEGLGINRISISTKPELKFNGTLEWDHNLNNGNPYKDLVLGTLTFKGDPKLVAKSGFVAGVYASLKNRYIYAEGSYLDFSASVKHAVSPKHSLKVSSLYSNICDTRNLKNWWYLNTCLSTSSIQKDISTSKTTSLSFGGSKLFKLGQDNYNHFSFGVIRNNYDTYSQNQIFIKHDFTNTYNPYLSYSVTVGEPVKDQLATQFAIQVSASRKINNKLLNMSAHFSKAAGGRILGYYHEENRYTIKSSYPIFGRIAGSIGYTKTNSSLDYYDQEHPVIGLYFEY